MRRFVFIYVLFLLLAPNEASAHATLDRVEPKVGSTVATAPRELKLWFTQKLEQSFSRIEVRDARGARVDEGKATVDSGDRTLLHVPLRTLGPGTYKVLWHVLSVDTHRSEGNFSFSVGQ